MNKPLPEMPPENQPQPVVPSPAGPLVGRVCVGLLLGMFFVALFGDFVVWTVYGTRFMLSPRSHQMDSIFAGATGLFVLLFVAQAKTDWNQGKRHLVLIGLFMLILGAIPSAQLCAFHVRFVTVKGAAVLMHPKIAFLTALLLLILACKCKAFSNIWQIAGPAFKPQDERRIVISK